jgi:cytochrome c oxidase subunit 2
MTRIIQAIFIAIAVFVFTSGRSVSGASTESPRRVEISAKRFAFEPNVITVKKGEPVVLAIASKDVEHGMEFYELGAKVVVPKHGVGELKITPEETGDLIGHCAVFCGTGHGTMTLTVHVVD